MRGEEIILFMDEVEFPLYYTSDYIWCTPDNRSTYKRKGLAQNSLRVITLYNIEYTAVQVHADNINKKLSTTS